MKQHTGAFHMFLPSDSFLLKLLLYMFYPAVMTGAALMIGSLYGNLGVGIPVEGICMIGVEFFIEWYLFSMIGAKKTRRLDFIKTSPAGTGVIEKALFANAIRRVITVVMVQIVAFRMSLIWVIPTGSLSMMKLCTASVYMILCMEVGALFIRILGGYVFLCLQSLGALVYLIGVVGILEADKDSGGLFLLVAAVTITAVIVNVAIVMNRIRGEYYDEGD